MRFIRKQVKTISDDLFLSISLKINLVLIGLHLYQFLDSGYLLNPLFRLIASCIYPILVFFMNRKGCYLYYFIYGNCLALQTDFQNYTAFVLLCLFIMLVPKWKYFTLTVYAIDILIVSTMHDKTPVHIMIHTLNCFMIYYTLNFLLRTKVTKRELILTNDEVIIVENMLSGKQQKEIELFSQNTVTNKLKQAKERNNIATTDELLITYRKQLEKK